MTILNSIKYQYQLNYYLFILQNTGLALQFKRMQLGYKLFSHFVQHVTFYIAGYFFFF